jgi:hypothetical protein
MEKAFEADIQGMTSSSERVEPVLVIFGGGVQRV